MVATQSAAGCHAVCRGLWRSRRRGAGRVGPPNRRRRIALPRPPLRLRTRSAPAVARHGSPRDPAEPGLPDPPPAHSRRLAHGRKPVQVAAHPDREGRAQRHSHRGSRPAGSTGGAWVGHLSLPAAPQAPHGLAPAAQTDDAHAGAGAPAHRPGIGEHHGESAAGHACVGAARRPRASPGSLPKAAPRRPGAPSRQSRCAVPTSVPQRPGQGPRRARPRRRKLQFPAVTSPGASASPPTPPASPRSPALAPQAMRGSGKGVAMSAPAANFMHLARTRAAEPAPAASKAPE